jgi:dolichyl-phosphate beta-glucosyltransferase
LKRWAFDIEAIYIAEAMHYPIAEVGVNWHEVEGSKLIKTKFDIVKTSAIMARDLLCNRLCYGLGVWKLPLS